MPSPLERRARTIAAAMAKRPARQPTFLQTVLLEEIDKALARRDRATLAALERLREVEGLPGDPRVRRLMQITEQVRTLLTAKGNAA